MSPNSHVAIAAGAQNGFNFGEVALAGIGGAVSAGIPDVFGELDGAITTNISGTAGQFAENFANGAIGSIVTQGIGVATGLQNNFNWAGVATAGVEQGIGAQGGVGGKVEAWLAGAATNSLLTGMNLGQSLVQEAPNTVAQIGGEALATGAEDALSGVQQLLSAPQEPVTVPDEVSYQQPSATMVQAAPQPDDLAAPINFGGVEAAIAPLDQAGVDLVGPPSIDSSLAGSPAYAASGLAGQYVPPGFYFAGYSLTGDEVYDGPDVTSPDGVDFTPYTNELVVTAGSRPQDDEPDGPLMFVGGDFTATAGVGLTAQRGLYFNGRVLGWYDTHGPAVGGLGVSGAAVLGVSQSQAAFSGRSLGGAFPAARDLSGP